MECWRAKGQIRLSALPYFGERMSNLRRSREGDDLFTNQASAFSVRLVGKDELQFCSQEVDCELGWYQHSSGAE